MSDLSLVLEQLKKNNEEESSRDTNINKNIAFSRKSNQESLEHLERAVIASNKETVDNDKIAASAEKETKKEEDTKDQKNLTFLQRISGGISNIGNSIKDIGGKALGSSFLKGAALFSLFFLLPKILQHPKFIETVKFIEDKVVPVLGRIKQFFVDTFGEDSLLVAGILGIVAILKPSLIVTPIMLAVKTLKGAFLVLKFFFSKTLFNAIMNLVTGVGAGIMKAVGLVSKAFVAIRTFMTASLLPALISISTTLAAAIVPLLPILAVLALVAAAFYSLKESVDEFNRILDDTGSVAEAVKAAIGQFIGTLLSIVPGLFLKLIGFVAKMFGFEEIAKSLPSITELSDIIGRGIKDALDFIQDIFGAVTGFIKKKVRDVKRFIFGDDRTEEEKEQEKETEKLKKDSDKTISQLQNLQSDLSSDVKITQKKLESDDLTAEERAKLEDQMKSDVRALAENRFRLEREKERNQAIQADLTSENYRMARGEGEFGQGDALSGMERTAALKAQEDRIAEINNAMLEKYGFQTNQQGQPVVITQDNSVRANSSTAVVQSQTITPQDSMLVSVVSDF